MRKRANATRWMPVVGVVLLAAGSASCGGGAGSAKASHSSGPAACPFVAKLDEIANRVARADVHDPDAFNKTLAAAVHEYVANLRELRAVAPVELGAGLDRVEADVKQYRFDAALTDRAALDAYASRTCGRVVQSGAPTSGSTTVGSAGTSTTGVAGGSTTTVAGDATTPAPTSTPTSTVGG